MKHDVRMSFFLCYLVSFSFTNKLISNFGPAFVYKKRKLGIARCPMADSYGTRHDLNLSRVQLRIDTFMHRYFIIFVSSLPMTEGFLHGQSLAGRLHEQRWRGSIELSILLTFFLPVLGRFSFDTYCLACSLIGAWP